MALAVGAGLRALDGRRSQALGAGLLIALAGAIWGFHAVFAAFVIAGAAALRLWREAEHRSELLDRLGWMVRGASPAALYAIPRLGALLRDGRPTLDDLRVPEPGGPTEEVMRYFTRVTTDVLPLERLLAFPKLEVPWLAAVGAVAVLVAWFVAWRGRRLFWVAVVLLSGALAVGPLLPPAWGAASGWLPLPMVAAQAVFPPLAALDRPDRLLLVAALGQAVIVGLVYRPLALRLQPRLRGALASATALAAFAGPFLTGALPAPVYDHVPPAWVEAISEPGAVLVVPLGHGEASILWQPLHGQPVSGGPDERAALAEGRAYRRAISEDPALSFFWDFAGGRLDAEGRARLVDRGAAYVVVYPGVASAIARSANNEIDQMLAELVDRVDVVLGRPIFDDGTTRVYRLRKLEGPPQP
jgi:hypothetical protein